MHQQVNGKQFKNNSSDSNIPLVSYSVTVEFWIDYSIFYIMFGFDAVLLNILIIIAIINNKKLGTFFFILIASHCFGQSMFALSNIIVGLYHLAPTFNPNLF